MLESLIALALLSILLAFVAPNWRTLLAAQQATVAVNQLLAALDFARASAITQRAMTVLCPSKSGQACDGEWHDGQVVAIVRPVYKVLHVFPKIVGGQLSWHGFKREQALYFLPVGNVVQNGTFVYCPLTQEHQLIRTVVVNHLGRVRQGNYQAKSCQF